MRSLAFVVPRFGEGIAGGAETLVGALASRLAGRGDRIEVWTTCARDNRTWENFFPEGEAVEYGLPVRRFPVDSRNLDVWIPHQVNIHEGLRLTVEQQLEWMSEGVNSSALYSHIDISHRDFDGVIFAPYLFGTTFFGALIHPENSLLIPCLHDENYAYTEIMQSLFRQVRGCFFNSVPEQDLARALFGHVRGGEVGMGFVPDEADSEDRYFEDDFPYVLYVGRKETGKNVQLLIDYFVGFKSCMPDQPLRLVVAGGGDFSDLHRPGALERGDIIDIQHVSESEKKSLVRGSLALCQPSRNESFSIVLMEAWLQQVPVLVHSGCAVTKHHAVESGGGLYFSSQEDFSAVCLELMRNPDLRRELGSAGRRYVEDRYSWEAVLKRFDSVLEELFSCPEDLNVVLD